MITDLVYLCISRKSAVAQYLLSAIMLTSFITCAHSKYTVFINFVQVGLWVHYCHISITVMYIFTPLIIGYLTCHMYVTVCVVGLLYDKHIQCACIPYHAIINSNIRLAILFTT